MILIKHSQIIKTVTKILISFILLWILVHTSFLDIQLSLNLFYKPMHFLCLISLSLIGILLSAWRWYRLNSIHHFNISYRETLASVYVGLTFNNLLPGSICGDLLRINYLLKRIPNNKITGVLSVLIDRIIGLLGILFSVSIISFNSHHLFIQSYNLSSFLSLCFYLSILSVGILVFILLLPQIRTSKKHVFVNKILKLLIEIQNYRKSPWIIFECLCTSIFIQIVIVLSIIEISRLLEFKAIEPLHYAISTMITQIVNLIPIFPGGLGAGEIAFAKIILTLNPKLVASYATIFLTYRILNLIVCAPGILVYLKNGTRIKPNQIRLEI